MANETFKIVRESCVGKKVVDMTLSPKGKFIRYVFEDGSHHDWPTEMMWDKIAKAKGEESEEW